MYHLMEVHARNIEFLLAGGVPIKTGSETIGAPGGDKDEVCANAGIAKDADKLK